MKRKKLCVLRFIAVNVGGFYPPKPAVNIGLFIIKKSQPSLKALAGEGGEGGIRTRDTLTGIYTFQAYLFNHSSTSPLNGLRK